MAYKKDQGRLARMAVFWTLAILIFWGCRSLYFTLGQQSEALGKALGGFRIPVLDLPGSPALLIAALVFSGAVFLLYRWMETPKTADMLIETESELKKVTWPTTQEVINSSVIVIVCVLFLMGFMALSDIVLARVAGLLLFGRG